MNPYLPLLSPLVASFLLVLPAPGQTVLFAVDGPGFVGSPQLLAGPGDVNRDGYPDLMVTRISRGRFAIGRVDVISGRDGRRLWTHGGLMYAPPID